MGFLSMELSSVEFERTLAEALGGMRLDTETALHDTGQRIVEDAQANAPIGTQAEDVPGFLRDNISVSEPVPTAGGAHVIVTSGAPYSVEVEYGTSKMPAEPFFRPALLHAHIEAPK